MNIAVGSDHRGLEYKKYVIGLLTEMGYDCKDFGSYNAESVDYPDIAAGSLPGGSQFRI